MVSRAAEKETFFLLVDSCPDFDPCLFYLFEKRGFLRAELYTEADERDRRAPYHFPKG